MTTRCFFSIAIVILFSFQIQAQTEDEFSIKISQVFPPPGPDDDVYTDTYESGNELRNVERILRNQYTGKDANYEMELITPSGKETKPIQNIRWILVTNGKDENWKTRPVPKNFYTEPTSVEVYVCNNDGSKIEKTKVSANYNHYYKFYIGGKEKPIKQLDYRPLDKCESAAKSYFDKNKPRIDSVFSEMRIYKDKQDSIAVASINNKEAYENFLRKKEAPAEEQLKASDNSKKNDACRNVLNRYDRKLKNTSKDKKAEVKKEAFSEIMSCIDIDATYSNKNIDKNLKLCKMTADKYMEDDEIQLGNIIEKLDVILVLMEKNPKGRAVKFDRFGHFEEPTKSKVKKGIGKLIKENESLKKPEKKKKK